MCLHFVVISCHWNWMSFIQHWFTLSLVSLLQGRGSCSCSNNAVHSGEKNGRICACVAPESGSPGSANEAGGGRAGPAVVWDSSAWDHWDDLEHHEHAVIGAAQCQLFWGHHCHVLCVR